MMPSIEVCVYCSHKIEEKEKSVNLPAGIAHLACGQKATTRTKGIIRGAVSDQTMMAG
jgi:hypothetical protein